MTMEFSASFGEWFRGYREQLHIQRAELAARLSCAPITLRKIETDERRPSRQMAEQLADHFSIPNQMRDVFIRVARGELPVDHLRRLKPGMTANTNLPNPSTQLTGREREIEEIQHILSRPEVRLLTLTGAPGVGKTRLAVEAAATLLSNFPDGVFLVPLTPLSDPELVLVTIAHTLQIGTAGTETLVERLGRYLHSQRFLLVLDNFEHVLEAAPEITRLITATTHLKVLVTSRSALELPGEHRLTLLPLGVPPAAENTALTSVLPASYAAVDLFLQRARAVKPDLTLSESNLRAVGQLCQRLDGLPLAIEFVAARCAFFTPQELLTQLDARFALQINRNRELPVRHLTLWQALDWSYSLLSPADQQLFRRLSIFVTSSTLEMVQQVCNSDSAVGKDGAVAAGVMDLLASSLLERHEDYEGNSRFRMLQTIREYALNQLEISGEKEIMRQQHAQYFLKMAQEAEKAWDGPDEWGWLRRLVVVRDDLRAALRYALDTQDAVLALRLNSALFSFWNTCSILTEAREWIVAALALAQSDEHFGLDAQPELIALKAKVLNIAGYMEMSLSDYDRAYAYFEQGLALYHKNDDKWGIAWSIRNFALIDLAWNKFTEVEKLLGESLKICEGSGDQWGLAWTLYATAFLKLAQGELDRAKELLEQSLVHLRQQKMKFGIYRTLLALGYTLFEQGDTAGAEAYFREALSLNGETPLLTLMTNGLVGLGLVAGFKGEPYRAARIWGSVEALREMTGEHPFAVFQRTYERMLMTIRSQVDAAEWRAAWATGRAMTLPQVMAEELNGVSSTPVESHL